MYLYIYDISFETEKIRIYFSLACGLEKIYILTFKPSYWFLVLGGFFTESKQVKMDLGKVSKQCYEHEPEKDHDILP